MTRRRTLSALAAVLCSGLLAACGGGSTNTVSVADTATPAPVTTSSSSTSPSSTTTATTTSTSTTTNTSSTSLSTRTQSGPAFVTTTSAPAANGPDAVVAAHGYAPSSPSTYNPQNTLQVVVATNQLGLQKAFFFVNGRYIGTDTSAASRSVSLVGQSDTEVTLGYALVHPDGSSAGTAQVSYALNNGQLSPLDPIPTANPTAPVSRR